MIIYSRGWAALLCNVRECNEEIRIDTTDPRIARNWLEMEAIAKGWTRLTHTGVLEWRCPKCRQDGKES